MAAAEDIEVQIDYHGQSQTAWHVGNGDIKVWIAKSLISDYCEYNGKIESIFIPEWLALKEGLI